LRLQVAQNAAIELGMVAAHLRERLPLTGSEPVGFHRRVKTFFIDGETILFEDVAGDFERETERGI